MTDFAFARSLCLAVGLVAAVSAPLRAAPLADTLERIKPSIVGIGTFQQTRRPPGKFVGTGFVVGDGRHAITNAHTLPERLDTQRKEHLAVLVGKDKASVRKARIVQQDRTHDVALVSFEGRALPAMKLRSSGPVREGELYAFTGFPIGMVLGFKPVTHRGIVSAITPIAIPQLATGTLDPKMIRRLRNPYEVYQLDATAYPGNSGSPVYDPETGVVIGVINKVFVKETKEAAIENPSGITYAIPIEHAIALMRKARVEAR
jgi:S1-C subfamily serine protease